MSRVLIDGDVALDIGSLVAPAIHINSEGILHVDLSETTPEDRDEDDVLLTDSENVTEGGVVLAVLGMAFLLTYGEAMFTRALRLYGKASDIDDLADDAAANLLDFFGRATVEGWPAELKTPYRDPRWSGKRAFNSQLEADVFRMKRDKAKAAFANWRRGISAALSEYPFPNATLADLKIDLLTLATIGDDWNVANPDDLRDLDFILTGEWRK